MLTDKPPFLNEDQVRAVLSYDDLIPAIRQALMDFSAGRALQPCARSCGCLPMPGGSLSCRRFTAA
jgi:ornithine cyclodeaminase/alanine dehydrogenase-like protein (mu-crystallin family)